MKFYLYIDEAKQWSSETYTLGELASIIPPSKNPSICPVTENGETGQAIFYRQYLEALNNPREQKKGFMETVGDILTTDINPPKPKPYTPPQNEDILKSTDLHELIIAAKDYIKLLHSLTIISIVLLIIVSFLFVINHGS